MAKKKGLLSEAVVRRFMGLAGMDVKLSSNVLKEAGIYEEEPTADLEEPVADAAGPEVGGEELGGEEVADVPEEPAMDAADAEGEVELTPEDIQKLKDLKMAADAAGPIVDKLDTAAGGEDELAMGDEAGLEGGEEELDAGGEEELDAAPADDELAPGGEEEEVIAEALSGINIQLAGDDLVQEITKRVAQRLLKAKKAQQALDEALGRKKTTPRRKTNRRK